MGKFAKTLATAALASMLALGMASCSGSSSAADDVVYRIAVDTSSAPFGFESEEGEYYGIDVEILAAVAADQGFEYELVSLEYDEAIEYVQSGRCDAAMAGISITEDLSESFDFSDPYYDSGVVLAVLPSSGIESYDQLEGCNVAVRSGSVGAEYAASIADEYGFTVVTYSEADAMYMSVLSGETSACFEDYPVMGYAITSGIGLQMVGEIQSSTQYALATSADANVEFLEMFNEGLANIIADGTYDQICEQYVSTGTEEQE